VTKHLLAKTMTVNDQAIQTVADRVGICLSSAHPEEELFCIADDTSPFKAHVVNKAMHESLQNGRVVYTKRTQNSAKNAYSFQCYELNLATPRELRQDQVRHIGNRYPGRFTRSDPLHVKKLASIAKTYFMAKLKSAVMVLDEVEKSTLARTDGLTQHMIAVQEALGGATADIIDGSRFVKCPVQTARADIGRSWREAPCSCHLTAVDTCRFVTEVKENLQKRTTEHTRKKKEQVSQKRG